LKGYELCIIFQPDTSDAVMDELSGALGDAIAKYNGSIIKTEKWGKRNLKFAIKKQTKGNFCFIFFNGTAEALKDIDRIARYNEQILRYTIMKLDKNPGLAVADSTSAAEIAPAAEPVEAVQESAPAAQDDSAAE
jgi:small subunit ribosomal protein S6